MKNRIDPIDDLIGKVLSGEATQEDKVRIEAWLHGDRANQKYFDQVKMIFDTAASTSVQLQFDTDAAWRKIRKKLFKGQPEDKRAINAPAGQMGNRPVRTEYAGQFSRQNAMRIAASILIIVALGYVAYHGFKPRMQIQAFASGTQTLQDTLPDGSTAFLNKQSEIRFEYDSRVKSRKVRLKGEAFFEVQHRHESPFIIETEELLIKDLGTAFNVKAYPESNTVEVLVERGEVQFYTLKNPGLHLRIGEKGIYDKTIKEFTKLVKIDTNTLSYKTRIFSFNNTDLGSVIDKLNEVYSSKIRLSNDALRDCHLTVNFNDDKFDTILDVLAETLNLTIRRPDPAAPTTDVTRGADAGSGEEIILDGKGCN